MTVANQQETTQVPRVGMLATVRNRRAIVTAVDQYDGDVGGRIHMVSVEYIDADGGPEDYLVWEREARASVLEPSSLPNARGDFAMPFGDFNALVRATRWGVVTPFVDPNHTEGLLRETSRTLFDDCTEDPV